MASVISDSANAFEYDAVLVTEPAQIEQMIQERQDRGIDHRDEVWEGVYFMTPLANDEHQDIVGGLTHVLRETIDLCHLGKSRPGVNLSDRVEGWKTNFRCPDVVVFLNNSSAEFHNTFWFGGPDLAVEIISSGDRSREKLAFYEKINTRELLLVDRDPWQLELHRLQGSELVLAGVSNLAEPTWIALETVPLNLRLQAGEGGKRPVIQLTHLHAERTWEV